MPTFSNLTLILYIKLSFQGDVFQFEYHQTDSQKTANLNDKQLETIADDLTKAFSEGAKTSLEGRTTFSGNEKTLMVRDPVKPDDIKDVYVFTWFKMRNREEVRNIIFFLST